MKQLITFRTLARTLSYQTAAEQLQYTPSTLFKHIQLLEEMLGVTLFCKQGRRLCLTADGQAFQEHAERILESYYQALDSVAAPKRLEGALTIGGCEINVAYGLLELLNRFSKENPKIRLNMMTLPNANIPMLLKKKMIDVGFVYSSKECKDEELKIVPLYEEPVCLMAEKTNPLLQKRQLTYEALAGMDFIYPHDTCCFVTMLLSRFKARNIQLGRCRYVGSVQLVAEHACHAGMLTLAPAGAIRRYAEAFALEPLNMAEEVLWARQNLIYLDNESTGPAARELIRASVQYAAELLQTRPAALIRKPQAEGAD